MKILLIHNRYQQHGGEDVIFDQEVEQLRIAGFTVKSLLFNNENFTDIGVVSKLIAGFKTIYNSDSVERVKKVIDEYKPDIVHIHNLFYTASPAIIKIVKDCGVPVVMTLHNYRLICAGVFLMREGEIPCERCISKVLPLDGIKYSCFRNSKLQSAQLTLVTSIHKILKTWQSVDRYIVLTEFAKNKILTSSLNLLSDQIAVKPNSIPDLGFVNPESRKDFLLFVGRLSTEKGIATLLNAIKQVPHVPIKIIGDGPLRNDVERICEKFPMVEYLGQQPREVVVSNLQQCKALMIPSIWYEGLPTVLLEALSTGTSILSADNPNLRSIVGNYASFFTPGDANSLAQQMKTVYNRKVIYNEALQLRGEYENKYAHSKVIQQQIDIYTSVINKRTAISTVP